jgi:hypothetical protein
MCVRVCACVSMCVCVMAAERSARQSDLTLGQSSPVVTAAVNVAIFDMILRRAVLVR